MRLLRQPSRVCHLFRRNLMRSPPHCCMDELLGAMPMNPWSQAFCTGSWMFGRVLGRYCYPNYALSWLQGHEKVWQRRGRL